MSFLPMWLVFWILLSWAWLNEALNLPIIKSLLDVDFYKINMLQVIFLGKTTKKSGKEVQLREIVVKYQMINRSKNVRIADVIPEQLLRHHLDAARKLRFTKSEVNYLRSLKRYREDFLAWLLSGFCLPEYQLVVKNGQYRLIVEANWATAMYWETIFMSIVAELYARSMRKAEGRSLLSVWFDGEVKLSVKMSKLSLHKLVRIADFGTRRRAAAIWQRYVLLRMHRQLGPILVGTSNVYLAWKLKLKPIGTMAHEMFMVMAAIHHESDEEVRKSQIYFLKLWKEFYGNVSGALTLLSDTFGVSALYEDLVKYLSAKEIAEWNMRQDSGVPETFGEKTLAFWKSLLIDPKKHTITYSDGLDVDRIIELHTSTGGRYNDSYGWGTDLMNDVGLPTLKIVVKALKATIDGLGYGLVKLSDEPGKYTAENIDDLIEYLRIFGHQFDEAHLRSTWQSVAV